MGFNLRKGGEYPELVPPLLAQLPQRSVLDGEIVIARDGALDFEALQLRLHPAESRVRLLAREIPASIVFFDLLALDDRDLRDAPFVERRAELERILKDADPPLHVTPATRDRAVAEDWFRRFEGAGLDGVMAKQATGRYEPNKRVMLKVKHERECDCVVAGFRWHKGSEQTAVGSLLLGLYDDAGALQHVGVCGSFTAAKRKELVAFLAPYRATDLSRSSLEGVGRRRRRTPGRRAGPAPSAAGARARTCRGSRSGRNSSSKSPTITCRGGRFRHTAQFRRWRSDKPPRDCTFAQLEVVPPEELAAIFGTRD